MPRKLKARQKEGRTIKCKYKDRKSLIFKVSICTSKMKKTTKIFWKIVFKKPKTRLAPQIPTLK
jgi:hypothetical protein